MRKQSSFFRHGMFLLLIMGGLFAGCGDEPGVNFENIHPETYTAEMLDHYVNTDSLLPIVNQYSRVRRQLDSLLFWTELIKNYKEESAYVYAQEAARIAAQNNKQLSQAISLYYLSILKSRRQNYGEDLEDAMVDAKISLRLLQSTKNKEWEVRLNNLMGALYYQNYQSDTAFIYLKHALSTLEEASLPNLLSLSLKSEIYHDLANVYWDLDSLDQTLSYYQKSMELYEQIDKPAEMARLKIVMGSFYRYQKQLPKAEEMFRQGLTLAENNNDFAVVADAYRELGNLRYRQYLKTPVDSIFLESRYFFKEGLKYQKDNLFQTYNLLGKLYQKKTNVAGEDRMIYADSAILYYQEAMREIQKENAFRYIKGIVNNISQLCDWKRRKGSDCRDILGDAYWKFLNENYDSVLNSVTAQLQLANTRFRDFEKDQLEAVNARRIQNYWLTTGAGLVFAAFFFLILIQRQQRKRLKAEKKLVEKLKKVDQIKDQFLANTSHELRTPLQGIIGLSESLYDREAEAEKQEDLSMIISSGKRLNSLVNDLLDFSKLKNFDIELQSSAVDLHVLTEVVLKNNMPLVQIKNLKLINAVPTDLPAARGDENRLQQILYNLIGNAIKFTESGHVRVQARLVIKDGVEFIEVGVEDTGIGIPTEKQKLIFQEFEQGDASISRQYAGTGLGLSISKRLIELQGGEIWLESEEGKGSTFFFTLPTSAVKAPNTTSLDVVSRPMPVALALDRGGNSQTIAFMEERPDRIHILVVDDEPVNQQVLKNHLASDRFQIKQAFNGREAIDILETGQHFDLVLLDVMMPHVSGYEVCQNIREKFLPSELPIIMVTAKNQVQDLVQGLSLGANDYLAKPFSKEEFLARVNTQLDLHRINTVTSKFVPNEFLRSLGRERISEVMLGDHTEREVSVLFLDIRDYTTLAENMTPEENFRFVNAFHGRLGPIIKENKGFVNQYLGDCIMAIFPESSENALKAAIGMQKEIRKYNQTRISKKRSAIRIGIGIHTGSLIMGVIGDKNRMDAATISDTVNTASRIESLTKHYSVSILLSRESLDRVENKENFHFRYLGKVRVKGKKEPVGIYECYDAESSELLKKRLRSSDDFESGLRHFFAKEFSQAATAFAKVLQSNSQDNVAQMFLHKSKHYMDKGTPDEWDGVEVMMFK